MIGTHSKKLRALAIAGALVSTLIAGSAIADVAYKVTSIICVTGRSANHERRHRLHRSGTQSVRHHRSQEQIDRRHRHQNQYGAVSDSRVLRSCWHDLHDGTFASEAGPNGVIFVDHKEIWGADADSTIKVVDLGTHLITHTIPLGLTKRADELCHDPVDNLVLIASDKDDRHPIHRHQVVYQRDQYRL